MPNLVLLRIFVLPSFICFPKFFILTVHVTSLHWTLHDVTATREGELHAKLPTINLPVLKLFFPFRSCTSAHDARK